MGLFRSSQTHARFVRILILSLFAFCATAAEAGVMVLAPEPDESITLNRVGAFEPPGADDEVPTDESVIESAGIAAAPLPGNDTNWNMFPCPRSNRLGFVLPIGRRVDDHRLVVPNPNPVCLMKVPIYVV